MEELERLAKAATPGPWIVHEAQQDWTEDISSSGDDHKPVCFGHGYDDYGSITPADAAYIAAASPDVVLDLIRRLREAESRVPA